MINILSTLTHDELTALVENAVSRVVKQQGAASTPQNEIIGRPELLKRLNITEPTAIRYERKGKIPVLRIGSSIRYNWPSVLEALETKKKIGGAKK